MIFEDQEAQTDADSITLLRILDVMYAVYLKMDETAARRLIDKHAEGGLISPLPQAPDPDQML